MGEGAVHLFECVDVCVEPVYEPPVVFQGGLLLGAGAFEGLRDQVSGHHSGYDRPERVSEKG
jgi:hypothetical protein